jgi:hypothetical protein
MSAERDLRLKVVYFAVRHAVRDADPSSGVGSPNPFLDPTLRFLCCFKLSA